jgi:hypothetical protein
MRQVVLAFLILSVAAGCSLLYEGQSVAPRNEVKVFPTGERAEYDILLEAYTVWFKNGNLMFRATGWNGSGGFPMRWAPKFREVTDRRIIQTDKGYIFDYGLKGGKIIPWGAWDKYEGWFEDGKKKYEYSYRTRKYIEWDNTGKVIKELNQSE